MKASMNLPKCPQCNSEYTYEDANLYICPECAHEWNKDEAIDEEHIRRHLYRLDLEEERLKYL